MRAPFTKFDAESQRNGVTWSYYSDDMFTWPASKWRAYFFVFLPHKLKWIFPSLVFAWWKFKKHLT